MKGLEIICHEQEISFHTLKGGWAQIRISDDSNFNQGFSFLSKSNLKCLFVSNTTH